MQSGDPVESIRARRRSRRRFLACKAMPFPETNDLLHLRAPGELPVEIRLRLQPAFFVPARSFHNPGGSPYSLGPVAPLHDEMLPPQGFGLAARRSIQAVNAPPNISDRFATPRRTPRWHHRVSPAWSKRQRVRHG